VIRLRSLYLCYLSLEDPLVHTQVIAYLRGLAADGHTIHLLTFEPRRLTRAQRRRIRASLAADGLHWHYLRYHKRPSLLATVYDALIGAACAMALIRRHRLDVLHARLHVPAAMALLARRLPWRRHVALIFDIRGLMAEEYVDAGRWRLGGVPFRLTKAVERRAIARADGIVVLTERVRRQLFGDHAPRGTYVIPCCADVDGIGAAAGERERSRAVLGLSDATVMTYVGKFGGWYMAAEMVAFFAVAARLIPRLHFLILTQGDQREISAELDRQGIHSGYTIASSPPEELASYLAAADFGVSFIRPAPSKISSSPTKVGEYLAAGLPVVSTAGVGDLDALISRDTGALVSEHTEATYRTVAEHVVALLSDAATNERCRATARRKLSLRDVGIPRYQRCYEDVADRV
jgi:glycosyltransferase involved in cell wall biosynthesis